MRRGPMAAAAPSPAGGLCRPAGPLGRPGRAGSAPRNLARGGLPDLYRNFYTATALKGPELSPASRHRLADLFHGSKSSPAVAFRTCVAFFTLAVTEGTADQSRFPPPACSVSVSGRPAAEKAWRRADRAASWAATR